MVNDRPTFDVTFPSVNSIYAGEVSGARVLIIGDQPNETIGYRFKPLRADDPTNPTVLNETGMELFCPDPTPSPDRALSVISDFLAHPPAEIAPVPVTVTRRQLLLALNGIGVTRSAIRSQLAGNEAALIEFDEAATFDRAHPLVAQLATALGMSTDQVDDLYRSAIVL